MNPNDLTHLNSQGSAEMVDVADRAISIRTARARGSVLLSPQVIKMLRDRQVPKGDVIAAARIAGIMGAKKTSDLIPLCHPIAIHKVILDFEITDSSVEIECFVKAVDRTGVEMEALTGLSIAALTIIDMVKSIDPSGSVTDIRVIEKAGGRNGHWVRPLN
jgi:cyclic pyranopterin phosphate synthase